MRVDIFHFKRALLLIICTLALGACTSQSSADWKSEVAGELPLLGHRNWVLIVDAAYPLQSSSSINTIVADEDIVQVAQEVLRQIEAAPHIKPIVYQDREFAYMRNEWSDGCQELRASLNRVVEPYNPQVILHDDIFGKLDAASQLFNVMVIKTACTVPYSSIFIELDCGYWQADYEEALRHSMTADIE